MLQVVNFETVDYLHIYTIQHDDHDTQYGVITTLLLKSRNKL